MPAPTPTPAATPGADGLTHSDQECHASSFGPASMSPADVNVEVKGAASSGQFWALVFQPLPIMQNMPTDIAWKLSAQGTFTITAVDMQGNQIDPSSSPRHSRRRAGHDPEPSG